MIAVAKGHMEVLHILPQARADVNKQNNVSGVASCNIHILLHCVLIVVTLVEPCRDHCQVYCIISNFSYY